MPNLQAVLRSEIQRIARREARSELGTTKKTVAQQRRDIADLKRRMAALERRVGYLESREGERLKDGPKAKEPPAGSRFSARALKNRRTRLGLSRSDYAKLAGVSPATIYNWESGRTAPGDEHLAALVALRGIGKREASRRLELL